MDLPIGNYTLTINQLGFHFRARTFDVTGAQPVTELEINPFLVTSGVRDGGTLTIP